MPTFRITAPDGKTYDVTGPEGSTPAQALERVRGQAKSAAVPQTAPDPTEGMSGFEKFAAGYGSAIPRLVRGVGQRLGMVSQADVDEANRLDGPLLNSGAGMAGNLIGNVAAAVPAVAIPGAATIPGAAAIGAVQGAAVPTSTGESVAQNVGIGAGAGAGGILLGRGVNALYQGGKSLIEPFTSAGRDRVAGRTLQNFGVTPADVQGLSGAPSVTGARPTLAEQITRPEGAAAAARLQGGLRSADPRTSAALSAREVENNTARVATLRDLAGQDGARQAAVGARQGAANAQYQQAYAQGSSIPAALQSEYEALLEVPAIRAASRSAAVNAENAGRPLQGVEQLHNIKLALDDAISQARGGAASPAQRARAAGLEEAQKRLVGFTERVSPDYGSARAAYSQMSRPINQMDVADEVLRRGTANTGDLAGTPRLMPNALLGAMRDEPRLMQQATGRNLGGSLDTLMEPNQLSQLRGVGQEVDRAAAVARAENGPGSATAQRLASQNVLRQTLGPLGAPQSWSESTMLNTLMRPVQFGYNQIAEPRIQQVISEAILDPSKAAQLLQAAQTGQIQLPNNIITQLTATAARVAPSTAAAQGRQ